MQHNERFINTRYLGEIANNLPRFFNNKGFLKRYLPSRFTQKSVDENNLWVKLNDLPSPLVERFIDMSSTLEEIMFSRNQRQEVLDSEQVKVCISNDTMLLPVVERLLASDGTPVYTIKTENQKMLLKPILVCWNCHWADLFSGNTKYGQNVFCLASDLTVEQRETFASEFITLQEVPEFLGWTEPNKENDKRLNIQKKK